MNRAIIGAAALLCLPLAAAAQQTDKQTPQVKPGTEATGQMDKTVPAMKECPGGTADQKTQADTKAKGTEATEAMSKNVPTMTAEAKDCPEDGQPKTKKN
jgi:hypothetical protein